MPNGERSDLAALPPADPRGKRLRRWIPGVVMLGGLVLVGLVIRFVWDDAPALPPKKPAQTHGNDMSLNGRPQVFGELAAASQRVDAPVAVPTPLANDPQLTEALKRISVLEQLLRDSQAQPAEVKPAEVKSTPQAKPNPQADAEARRRAEARAKEAKDATRKQREEDAAARRGRLIWERKSEKSEVGAVKTVSLPYTLMPGWMIPCALKYAMSSRAPGAIVAIVTQNVYDSVTGDHLLMPQGATLNGQSSGGATFGDDTQNGTISNMVVGKQIYTMGNSKLQDLTGQTGLKDQVETFWSRALLAIGMKSVLQAGGSVAASATNNVGERIANSAAQQTAAEGARQVQQLINISPRLTVRQGYRCLITVQEPISFSQPYTPIDHQRTAYRARNGW